MKNKRLTFILLGIALILFIPWVAMQFTTEVNWSLSDFIIAGVLLLGTGILCEIAIRKIKNIHLQLAVCGIILLFFLLVWAELAVGIF
ncbi:MAG: hypothetical protein V2I54_04545 [Bacteroidales bacterium]|jgi:hypothetical protein|nr:hypothetical protein [Bacteroidales bacterium]